MSKRSINGADFTAMVLAGAEKLQQHAEHVNSLNVFPVPDGDTGTNMNLTMTAGANELKKNNTASVGQCAGVLSKGLLMGARGNSGVILSQLFRGLGRYAAQYDELNTQQFAAALQTGVDTAYKAVVKPVEGTILTVAKEAARHAVYFARRTTDITELMTEVLAKAKEALANTPELLPVLKQVGVVDSGGQGLVYIYEGFHQYLTSGSTAVQPIVQGQAPAPAAAAPVLTKPVNVPSSVQSSAQSQLHTEDIEFLYDMEFFINRQLGGTGANFDEGKFRKALSVNGDSIIVISDDETIKVHVHSKTPGDVLNLALLYGEITQIHILNMREQHRDLLTAGMDIAPMPELFAEIPKEHSTVQAPAVPPADDLAPYGFIAVSSGDGISEIFKSLGVDVVLAGGQTMNPSTEDFVNAISSISAKHVYLLPNNSNIVLAAQQAKDLLESEREVTVIPSKSIPQGIAAAFAFQEDDAVETNTESMLEAISQVKSGQVTNAVRDTVIEELEIKSGQFIGISNSKIVAASDELLAASQALLDTMLVNGDEIVTVLTGAEADEGVTESLVSWLEESYPQVEVEVHEGGQPLYYYLFSVEP
ncbi:MULTISPECIES: DAK2 domain-containing protein [unclassified Paenibacillus]|uniref:DAK2 domain-containing protein n=1 Tax=unclassified Paenibacillus TaxID=185978 RepID=UPI002404BFF8|nr:MULTISPECIES: DAK2 domain-containing protein [unclassified Paenibacillus]MDF9842914.1 DAK2 domain fusion protein YloV [Paenibacillus sp. PastF-2]MDF9849502.1 DAK2 domain fusion protein YloV [Paenibacillus sp. PastM-2]MDF9856123.1 DAK2 domain fusion protein YloV [Paenibacillus sp. PastF-1]MDH6481345.1 DAK2 domain fusion protein YloV [Paenibacillus sp. PastH-2]MDH6508812.1 DAK2 domain fusion protein YloV [Paenibacillus sp. PastM-3]